MSLEGNLTSFGLSEILQLIAVQQKSGMLSITSEDRSKVLFFRDGKIISTRDRRQKTKDPFRDYLTRYGIMSREDLIRLSQISTQAKLDLTETAVSEGFLSETDMRRHFRNHVQEEVHDVLTWEQCSYKFIPGLDIITGIKTWGDHNVEGMLMESMRRIDEFPETLKLLPDLSTRVSRAGKADESHDLTANETRISDLLDKERTLSSLIGHAKCPRYETYEAIRHLHDKGLVEIRVDQSIEIVKSKSKKRTRKKRQRGKRNILPVVVSCLLFLLSLAWGASGLVPYIQHFVSSGTYHTDKSTITRNRAKDRLGWLLEGYYAQHGRYPSKLSQLTKAGLTNEAFLREIDGYSFRYHLTAEGRRYTLL
ncbi:MAG: DUF4388 domain-containing protein [Candidatus Krumholzibacteria bacterium]|nr:DUF4388 domain-containing protein [Candidatus Krumholzibacteria bacterium]